MRQARQAIIADKFPEYVHQFFSDLHGGDKTKYPQWAVDALRKVDIDLLEYIVRLEVENFYVFVSFTSKDINTTEKFRKKKKQENRS